MSKGPPKNERRPSSHRLPSPPKSREPLSSSSLPPQVEIDLKTQASTDLEASSRQILQPPALPQAGASSQAVHLRPLERLVGLYALLSSSALAFPGRPSNWPLYLGIHLLFSTLLLPSAWLSPPLGTLKRLCPRPLARFLRDWYPLLLLPWIYGEVAVLNTAVHQGQYFDDLVVGWEGALFGGQPSQIFSAALPSFWLSETLHGAYLAYYAVLYGPALIVWISAVWRGESSERYHALLFPLLLTFFFCELSFVFFPVSGPRYHFPAALIPEGPISNFVRAILASASSQGTAFPSSHAALSVAQTILVGRYLPRLYRLCVALTVGLCLGAVYGGYHYAIDMVVGVLVGMFGVWLADRVVAPLPNPAQTHGQAQEF